MLVVAGPPRRPAPRDARPGAAPGRMGPTQSAHVYAGGHPICVRFVAGPPNLCTFSLGVTSSGNSLLGGGHPICERLLWGPPDLRRKSGRATQSVYVYVGGHPICLFLCVGAT